MALVCMNLPLDVVSQSWNVFKPKVSRIALYMITRESLMQLELLALMTACCVVSYGSIVK